MAYRKRNLLPIGVHMNADAVYMVQLDQTDTGIEVVAKASRQLAMVPVAVGAGAVDGDGVPAAHQPTVNEEEFEEARQFVREKIATGGFQGREAVISLPSEFLVIQHVRLAPVQPDELAGSLIAELQGKLPFDPLDAVTGHIVAGSVTENNETKQDVIVLAARRDIVEEHVAAVTRLGLRVVGVGVEPCTMCYPFMFAASRVAATADGPPTLMLIHVGTRTTNVAITRGPETMFVKGVELGMHNLIEALAAARSMTFDEAAALLSGWRDKGGEGVPEAVAAYNSIKGSLEHVVDEIKSCLRYHASLARGAHIDRFFFVGPAAQDRALVRVIGAHLGVTCEVGNPLGTILEMIDSTPPEPELTVAAGLSLFGAQ